MGYSCLQKIKPLSQSVKKLSHFSFAPEIGGTATAATAATTTTTTTPQGVEL